MSILSRDFSKYISPNISVEIIYRCVALYRLINSWLNLLKILNPAIHITIEVDEVVSFLSGWKTIYRNFDYRTFAKSIGTTQYSLSETFA